MSLSRRSFLAASAAFLARPALAQTALPSSVDVVIVGAGAAGIAAARRIAASGRRFVLIEASDHVGGRCVTDTRSFDVPFDRGAHWIHFPDLNPVVKLAQSAGLDIYPAPPNQKVRIGRRNAREGELEDFLAFQVRSGRALRDTARKTDMASLQALPNDLADWRPTIEFVLGPYAVAKDLAQVSALDYAKAPERNAAAFCRQGFGTLLARLAEGVPVQLTTPATAIDWRQNIAVETPKGTITARAVIVTASTGVIGSGRIKFTPDLPKPQLDACNRLSLGSYDHIALELVGNPLGLQSDDLVFEKSNDARTAAILGNISGTPLCLVEVAGAFGRELSAKGKAAMVDFAATWLAGLYGPEVKKAIKRVQATRWNDDPWTLGASSAAATGGQGARRVLMEPVRDAIWFAGEAVHETLWGTVGGAWESGERAADAALHRLSALKEAAPAKREPAPKGKRKPRRERVHAAPRRGREAFPSIMRDESR